MSRGLRSRVAFVDWLRLAAALQMITGHTVDAVLVEAARASIVFDVWTRLRGLTAPAFLLASGISFALASRLDDEAAYAGLRSRHGSRRRRIVRSAWLVVLGTLLHAFDAPWLVDVLQCVGVTLLALDLAVTLLPRPRDVTTVVALAALATLAVALPLDRAILADDHRGLARYALAWIDRDGGSLFPLIPWAFYPFAGVLVARIALPAGARTAPRSVVAKLLFCAGALAVFSWTLDRGLEAPRADTWSSHPAVVLGRTSAVLALAGALAAAGARWDLPRWGTALAGETLALYVTHLLVLFAPEIGPGRLWAHELTPARSLGLAAVMVAGSVGVALAWARLWPPLEARWFPFLRPPELVRAPRGDR